MAKHICYVHQNMRAPKTQQVIYEPHLIRAYIAFCKKYQPMIPRNVQEIIMKNYVKKRSEYKKSLKHEDEGYLYTTPRTLLGIIRLA